LARGSERKSKTYRGLVSIERGLVSIERGLVSRGTLARGSKRKREICWLSK
jgi:hypothetical protein